MKNTYYNSLQQDLQLLSSIMQRTNKRGNVCMMSTLCCFQNSVSCFEKK